ncbi:hypothetical protein G9464_09740 [Halostella sp. JP-L12]|uniref:hypothetical protein n=1 Tax=Halostella TaxID=1843185 RepID=UPI000EF80259|nr:MULTISPECIES: hypothetical protein [Halostella]NHN47878.1 hypothetical protein [Halostella sp. JP-L12]
MAGSASYRRGIGSEAPLPTGALTSPSRYDVVLVLVPVAFLAALLVGEAVDAPLRVRLATAALACLPWLVDCLFLNPPTEGATG